MREKELRIALVCYGGISLAVYMHGVTKEVWRLAKASRAFHDGAPGTTVESCRWIASRPHTIQPQGSVVGADGTSRDSTANARQPNHNDHA